MSETNTTPEYGFINWIKITPLESQVWPRTKANEWTPETVAVSNDRRSWEELSEAERDAMLKIFAGLTLLDSRQAQVGVPALRKGVTNPFEDAILAQFNSMEFTHVTSYSTIFQTLCSKRVIDDLEEWALKYKPLQKKADLITHGYHQTDPLKLRIASVFLESFLFYSGFFYPLHLLSKNAMTNTATIIKLIIRDEAIHGTYIGHTFKKEWETLSDARKSELQSYAYEFMNELYTNEMVYTDEMYNRIGLVSEVQSFLCLNANKAFQQLGFDDLFPPEDCQVNPAILRSMRSDSKTTHDFFSVKGSAYFMPKRIDTTDEDWM